MLIIAFVYCIIYNTRMKRTTKITNRRKVIPVSMTDDMINACLLHSQNLPGCPRPHKGSVSYFVWVAVLEKLKKCGLDMSKIDLIYKLKT
jgi:hypothetical protein